MAKKKTLSETLKAAIKASGLTHYMIGKRAGVTPPMIARFMAGTRDLRLATADKLAEALGLELRPVEIKKARSS